MVVHHLQPVVGHFLKKVCHASVSGGYANILFRNARAAGAAATASAGGGSTVVQPRFSGSTAPLPSSTGLNRVKPLCEVPDSNEHVGLRHYHSPDDLSWDEWRLSDSEVERIDLENAASPEEADEIEEMTADEMAVDGYYVVAGIARHEYKQGWKFLTLWDGYGLSEATWEPMSAFIQPDGSINPIFRTYLVENNEGQLLTRAETMSQRKKRS